MENENYNDYIKYLKEISYLKSANQLLQWDIEVMAPEDSYDFKSEQLSYLAGLIQEKTTEKHLVNLVLDLYEERRELSFEQRRNVEETYKDISNSLKLSKEFVEKLNITVSKAYNSWKKAKEENDFSYFVKDLGNLIELKREEAQKLSVGKNYATIYDALLNEYEPGCTIEELDKVFSDLKEWLVPLISKLKTQKISNPLKEVKLDEKKQWELLNIIAKELGYDFRKGRIDASIHPFSVGLHPTDSRITSRFKSDDPLELIWSGIHEVGHSLYEQGLDPQHFGTPRGEAISLGIHESQSRFWENNIGRSLNYCKRIFPHFQKLFPEEFKNLSVEDLFHTLNIVSPGLIRTSADELTYHLHIIIRYEIEKEIINGNSKVEAIPEMWNEKYIQYLGIEPDSYSSGVLQDIHWAQGSFGYFPTYSLGSLYAAQFFHFMKKEIPSFTKDIENGDFTLILNWLRKNIHIHGRLFTASELCINATGEKLSSAYFKEYIGEKLSQVYNVDL